MPNYEQILQIKQGKGFIAALDQSGGSTPKALGLYGVDESYYTNEDQMYNLIHAMRARIATAPTFTGDKVIGAILFEMTMNREISKSLRRWRSVLKRDIKYASGQTLQAKI